MESTSSAASARDAAHAGRGEGPQAQQAVHRDIIVIGASAGGVEALNKLVGSLPAELPASIFVVLHLLSPGTSMLASILDRAGPLPARTAADGDPIERGQISVAPPDLHLLLHEGVVQLSRGPRENGHRPAIDPLFRSAARAYGRRVVAVVLTGALDDGAAGMRFVKDRLGTAVVQDPDDASYPSMPESAIFGTDPDHVVPLAEMAAVLCDLLERPLEPDAAGGDDAGPEEDPATGVGLEPGGEPAGLTCPECGGALWESEDGPVARFACRVGHAFSPESLVTEQSRALEAALWGALQSLEERADILRRMATRAAGAGSQRIAERFQTRARGAEEHARAVRGAIAGMTTPDGTPDESESAA